MTLTKEELYEQRNKILNYVLNLPEIAGKKVCICRHLKGRFDFLSDELDYYDVAALKLNKFDFVLMGMGSQFGVCYNHFSTEYAVIISKSLMSGC